MLIMKIDFTKTLTNLRGDALQTLINSEKPEGGQRDMTYVDAVTTGLLSHSDPKWDAKKKMEMFLLAQRVHEAKGAVEISKQDGLNIEEAVCKTYPVLVTGQVCNLLK